MILISHIKKPRRTKKYNEIKKGVKKSLLVVDMPKGTYKTKISAKKNAKKVMNLTKCDAVKLESNGKNFQIIKELKKSNIPVMGHIGFTPQFKKRFKIEGDTQNKIKELLNEIGRAHV